QNTSGSRDQYQPSASQIRSSAPSAPPTTITTVRLAEPGSAQPRSHSLVIGSLRWTTARPPVERVMSHILGDPVERPSDAREGGGPVGSDPILGGRSRADCSGGGELPKHVVQDAAVHEVLLLLRRVDSHARVERELLAVRLRRGHANPLDAIRAEPFDIEDLGAVEAETFGV